MDNAITLLDQMQRPRILVMAARHALTEYRRDSHLPRALRHLGARGMPAPGRAFDMLIELEATMDAQRRERAATWRADRHVLVLCALMAEARILAACADATAQEWSLGDDSDTSRRLARPAGAVRPVPVPRPAPLRRRDQPNASGSDALRRAT